MAQELVPAMGNAQASGVPIKKLDPEVSLKILDGFRNGTLRYRQGMCAGTDRAMFRNSDKISELSQGE